MDYISEILKIAAGGYPDKARLPEDPEGDGLFRWACLEIQETNDPDAPVLRQLEEARRVVLNGARDLLSVAAALAGEIETGGRIQRSRKCAANMKS
jgi:hypothetical protein